MSARFANSKSQPGKVCMATLIHGPVIEMIRRTHPGWSSQDVICLSCLNRFRADDVEQVVEAEKGELSSLEGEVVRSLKEYELGLTPRGRSRGS